MNDQSNGKGSLWAFVTGMVVGAIGAERWNLYARRLAERLREEADRAILDGLVAALSRRLRIPSAVIARVLDDHAHDPAAWQAVQASYRGCQVVFSAGGDSTVDVAIEVRWADGGSSIVEQRWSWERVPPEVRGMLMRQRGPVRVGWQLPALTQQHSV